MCNNLKNGNQVYPIPEWGFGYKVFDKNKGNGLVYTAPFSDTRTRKGVWKKWWKRYGTKAHGFCFFLTLKDLSGVESWHWDKSVCKIRYSRGLGRRRELGGYMSSLCKEFKILKEVDIKDLK